jgi:hypothetical protein
VGTFGLAPLFKRSFKEDVDWATIYTDLVAGGGVPSVAAAAAYGKRKRWVWAVAAAVAGCALPCEQPALTTRHPTHALMPPPPQTNKTHHSAVLVDVRLARKYEDAHPAGARSVPLYIPIQGWSPAAVIRRVGFSFFGIYGTQLNTQFAEEAAEIIPKGERSAVLWAAAGYGGAALPLAVFAWAAAYTHERSWHPSRPTALSPLSPTLQPLAANLPDPNLSHPQQQAAR